MKLLLLAILLSPLDVRVSDACATAPPAGAEVQIAEEEALVTWDPATKTETFIRRAAFHASARSFGFLVPTPTVPQLSEMPDGTFDGLANLIRPRVKIETHGFDVELGALLARCAKMGASKGEIVDGGVRVLATARVAGFDATTIAGDDAAAVNAWLAGHGFAATPALERWLAGYVRANWKITAFVIAGDSPEVATGAVKMTFQTDRPFYPYREPQREMAVETTAKLAPRLLRVYVLADRRSQATLAGQPWSATVRQASQVPYLPGELQQLTAHRYLTVFVDDSSPRRGIDEVYFAPSADPADVAQAPVIVKQPRKLTIPVDLVIVLLGLGLIIRRRRNR